MDERYLIAADRYIELNPVRAGIVKNAGDYKWSSCRAHLEGKDDILVRVRPMLEIIPDWYELLTTATTTDDYKVIRRHERIGRPLGSDRFISRLDRLTSRMLRRRKPGPKKGN